MELYLGLQDKLGAGVEPRHLIIYAQAQMITGDNEGARLTLEHTLAWRTRGGRGGRGGGGGGEGGGGWGRRGP